MTAVGYRPELSVMIKNAVIWFVILGAVIFAVFWKKVDYKRVIAMLSGILLAVQLVAFSTLFLTAKEDAFTYPEGEYCFDMTEQLTVSSKENILILCLDTVPNEWLEETWRMYPEMLDCLKDFTYYNNTDCCYWGTFPSVTHVLSGNPLETGISMNTYFEESWNNERTNKYFELLKKHDYKVNGYVVLTEDMVGQNSLQILEGKFSNVVKMDEQQMHIDYDLLYETMIYMSCYRYAPNVLKPLFNVTNGQYTSIVSYPDNKMAYGNHAYYAKLLEEGIQVSDECNYFSFTLLNGAHEFANDEYCRKVEGQVDRNQTIKGITVMLEEYLLQLQEAGVYDNSTIIIMSDHGTGFNAQPIFFIKRQHEQHDALQQTNAPITYKEFVPTIVQILGEDYTEFGESIYDYSENQWRERIYLERDYDSNYPDVMRYDGTNNASTNVWRKYTYSGDRWYLISNYELFQYETIPMVDSYY